MSLADLPWQARWLGKESKLEGIGAAPEQGGSWKPRVAWGPENEIAVAVDNGFAGGGLYRGPRELVAGESLSTRTYVPGKTASFLIGGEVFRRLPRGADFPTPEDDQVFSPGAVSFQRNAALLVSEDCYMQARPTDWRPLRLPEQPRRILSVGSCQYFDWDGTGVVDLRIEGGTGTLRIYPDVDRVSAGLRGTVEQPLTRLVCREHAFPASSTGLGRGQGPAAEGPGLGRSARSRWTVLCDGWPLPTGQRGFAESSVVCRREVLSGQAAYAPTGTPRIFAR